MMMNKDVAPDHVGPAGFRERFFRVVDALRSRVGASRRQFALFSLLLLVACTFWARPAGMLIWHRLRIVTGMPRMAIANEDPEMVASVDADAPASLQAGREVTLDRSLRRDPFRSRFDEGGEPSAVLEPVGAGTESRHQIDHLTRQIAGLRLSGTSKGLGSAVVDGRVRVVGSTFKVEGLDCRLLEVGPGSVLIEAFMPGDRLEGHRFLVDRGGVRHLPGK